MSDREHIYIPGVASTIQNPIEGKNVRIIRPPPPAPGRFIAHEEVAQYDSGPMRNEKLKTDVEAYLLTVPHLAHAAHRIMSQISGSDKYILYGHSLGGAMVLATTLLDPRVEIARIIAGPNFVTVWPPKLAMRFILESIETLRRQGREGATPSSTNATPREFMATFLAELPYLRDYVPELARFNTPYLLNLIQRTINAEALQAYQTDRADATPQRCVEIYQVKGDAIFPLEESGLTQDESFRNIRVHIIPGHHSMNKWNLPPSEITCPWAQESPIVTSSTAL